MRLSSALTPLVDEMDVKLNEIWPQFENECGKRMDMVSKLKDREGGEGHQPRVYELLLQGKGPPGRQEAQHQHFHFDPQAKLNQPQERPIPGVVLQFRQIHPP